MEYKKLIEVINQLTHLAIQGKLRSDVFCAKVLGYVAVYRQALEERQNPSVFGGNRAEDYGKLDHADDGAMTTLQARRLEAADDEGKDLMDDDGDAFGG